MFDKEISFMLDGRLPVYWPINWIRWHDYSKCLSSRRFFTKPDVDVMFTLDIEHDYGSMGDGRAEFVSPFLKKAQAFFGRNGISATLFVQGNMIEKHAEQLHDLGKHEFGLHGYAHEPWGDAWFVRHSKPPQLERRNLLTASLQAFERVDFPKPTSFRAPNMVLDKASLQLLRENGFTIDSSYPSYQGDMLHPFNDNGIFEIPVSADPKPHFGRFLVTRYAVFNTSNLVTGEFSGGFSQAILRLVNLQRFRNTTRENGYVKEWKPCFVFMCHPWEFFKPYNEDKNLQYCKPENWDILQRSLDELREIMNIRFVTMREFRDDYNRVAEAKPQEDISAYRLRFRDS